MALNRPEAHLFSMSPCKKSPLDFVSCLANPIHSRTLFSDVRTAFPALLLPVEVGHLREIDIQLTIVVNYRSRDGEKLVVRCADRGQHSSLLLRGSMISLEFSRCCISCI